MEVTTIPFKSKRQARYLFAKHPSIAKRWADHTPDMKALPETAGSKPDAKKARVSLYAAPAAKVADDSDALNRSFLAALKQLSRSPSSS